VVGILSVLITGSIGQSRILYVMSRDGLMPRFMANVNAKTGSPVETTLLLGLVTAVLAAIVPLDALADLVSIGTLAAFCVVSVAVVVMRRRAPDAPRTFRTPWVPALPIAGVAIDLYLMSGLSRFTWTTFFAWLAVGLAVYFAWGRRSAARVFDATTEAEPPEPMLTGAGP
jgi:APA family basic amino acid/polyamine antiporter